MTASNDTLAHPLTGDAHLTPAARQAKINADFGLLVADDDEDEDRLTILDLKPVRQADYDLSVFDALARQCDAVLLSTNTAAQQSAPSANAARSHSSRLTTSAMINDYQERFQWSLQKLTVPTWYTEPAPQSKRSPQPSPRSASHYERDAHRTPEIVHVRRPLSYRSYRSSLATSPSPSIHSWHPQHMMDGVNFAALLPSSSNRPRHHHQQKHEKGIERVTKSSRWYQPTQFTAAKTVEPSSTPTELFTQQVTAKSNQLDSHRQRVSRLSGESARASLINSMKFDDGERAEPPQSNSRTTNSHSLTNDKPGDQRINSNGFQTMPLADEQAPFGRVELEDVTDEEEEGYDKRPSTSNIHPAEPIDVDDDDDEKNALLERLAGSLVDSILNDVLLLKEAAQEAEINAGVRELSDDENALRELDENDISETDEFIVFSTQPATGDDDRDDQTVPMSSLAAGGSLNRLFTFSRTNDDGTLTSKPATNRESPTSPLMIVDTECPATSSPLNATPELASCPLTQLDANTPDNSLPIYRSHIQKRHINLGRYYDGMMRAGTSQMPTHDLRCHLFSSNALPHASTDGVTEETVRQARLLLDSIPTGAQLKTDISEDGHEHPTPLRPILKNTRFTLSDEQTLPIDESARLSPRRVITTTVTEEYRRIQRKIIEELEQNALRSLELTDAPSHDSNHSSNHPPLRTHHTLIPSVSAASHPTYELLSDCYSGYSYTRSDFLVPIRSPLVSNVSPLPSTTDEAYESDPTATTTSPRSPTMSSSTAATNHIHPDLEHEFEYPSPPPPVPDRRLKPAHLRPAPPPTKPRTIKQPPVQPRAEKRSKPTKTPTLAAIQQLIASAPNDAAASSARTLSSRHYCGSIPLSGDSATAPTSNSSTNNHAGERSTANSKKSNGSAVTTPTEDNGKIVFSKSSTSSMNRSRAKKTSSNCFDETTNGLAVRLPIPAADEHEAATKPILPRAPVSSSGKAVETTAKPRPVSDSLNSRRSSVYETSV